MGPQCDIVWPYIYNSEISISWRPQCDVVWPYIYSEISISWGTLMLVTKVYASLHIL